MTLKQYLNNLPKTKSEILINLSLDDCEVLLPFSFKTQEDEDYAVKDKYCTHCKKGDLFVTDGSSVWECYVYDINQEIDLDKNSIYAINRLGFKDKLTFYIQNLIPVGNLQ
jgi:hypothetical protein